MMRKQVPDFPAYEVSPEGQVWARGRSRKLTRSRNGHVVVSLNQDGRLRSVTLRTSNPGRGSRPTPIEVSALRADGLVGDIAERFRTTLVVIEAIEQGKPWALTTPIEGERWAPLPGFFVEVSDYGRVRSSRFGNLLRLRPNDKGYVTAALPRCSGGFQTVRIHRAVVTAFGGPSPSQQHLVNHKNCVRDDNRLCNLEWVTPRENSLHAHAAGRHPPRHKPVEPLSWPTDTPDEMFREIRKGFWVSNRGEVGFA